MNLSELLKPEVIISASQRDSIQEEISRKPWCEITQLSWIKALHQTKDARFQKELERVAFISSDRQQLYSILFGKKLQDSIDKIEDDILKNEEGTFIAKPIWSEKEQTADITQADESEELQDELKENLEEPPEIPVGLVSEELDKEFKLQAVQTIISQDVQEDIEQQKNETLTEPEPTSVSSDEFISWLIQKASQAEYHSFERGNYSKPSSGVSTKNLVDTFIKNEPKITPKKSREYGLEDLAKESLVDNEEFVTETLAEIYAAQGNISKAKRAFELLSLNNPEKSIYFAARIKQLGKKT